MKLYLMTIAVIFGVILIGIGVERLYRHFQAKHPELGPYRRRDGGCNCHCPVCDENNCEAQNDEPNNVK